MAIEKIVLKKGTATAETYTSAAIDGFLNGKQAAGNYATLGSDGKVPTSQLPSYVDDVLEYATRSAFPATGEAGKIYIAKDTNKTYRWSGSAYVEISASLALGETSSTAYAGDKGKANAQAISALQSGKADKATTLSGYGITDAYTKTEVDTKVNAKATKATTLSGYGITDAYTKSQVDSAVATAVPKTKVMTTYTAHYAISDGQIEIYLASNNDTAAKEFKITPNSLVWNNQTIATVDQIPDVSNKADKATTLAGYGITDAYTKTQTDTLFVHQEISLSNGRYVGGYHTDVDTDDGYLILGLEDQQTPDEHHALFIGSHSVSWDGHPLATESYVYQNYASKATTLAGYGITDAYTKTQVDTQFSSVRSSINGKLDQSTTYTDYRAEFVSDDGGVGMMLTKLSDSKEYYALLTARGLNISGKYAATQDQIPDISGKADHATTAISSDGKTITFTFD